MHVIKTVTKWHVWHPLDVAMKMVAAVVQSQTSDIILAAMGPLTDLTIRLAGTGAVRSCRLSCTVPPTHCMVLSILT